MIIWEEDIKEGEGAQSFRILTDVVRPEKRDQAVQTEKDVGQEDLVGLMKEFLNLRTGGGLLPDPPGSHLGRENLEALERTVVVYPHNQHGGKKVIHPSPSLLQQLCEGDWARHPCCGTIGAVRSTPLRPMTNRERFGPAPM